MRYRVLPYRQGSKGAKALADALGGKVLKLQGSSFVWKPGDVVINWGNVDPSLVNGWPAQPINYNQAAQLKGASNKKLFFELMYGANLSSIIPRFWVNKEDIPDDAFPVVCRTVLAGHSGDGIVIANDYEHLVNAPLYVQYVKKKDEYRVHVGKKERCNKIAAHLSCDDCGYPYSEAAGCGDHLGPCDKAVHVIAVQRKARRHDTPDADVNWQVRNHDNGFVFVRGGVNPPADVLGAARSALLASGLDFGAVDVIYNEQQEKAYVLEINTAPGLEGQTIADYAAFFKGGAA
jgi:hypothetical protein